MRMLIENLAKKLESLITVLSSRSYSSWITSELSLIKDSIKKSRSPLVPSRAIWERYAFIVSLIEETQKIASKPGYEYALHTALISLKEHINEFGEMLKKAYVMERVQIAIPAVLGFISVLIKILGDGLSMTWLYIPISLISIALATVSPLLSLLGTGILGCLLVFFELDISSIFTGVLLIAVSALYIYLLLFTKSSKFVRKLEDAIRGVDQAVKQGSTTGTLKVEDVLLSIRGNYSVEESGIFRFLDKEALLRYKATLLIAMGYVSRAFIQHSNKNHE